MLYGEYFFNCYKLTTKTIAFVFERTKNKWPLWSQYKQSFVVFAWFLIIFRIYYVQRDIMCVRRFLQYLKNRKAKKIKRYINFLYSLSFIIAENKALVLF